MKQTKPTKREKKIKKVDDTLIGKKGDILYYHTFRGPTYVWKLITINQPK